MNSLRNLYESVVAWLGVEAHRARLYSLMIGLGVLLQAYGVVTSEQWAPAVSFAALVLGVGMARANTTTKPQQVPSFPDSPDSLS